MTTPSPTVIEDCEVMRQMLRIEGRIGWQLLSRAAKLPDCAERRNLKITAAVIKLRCQALEELIND